MDSRIGGTLKTWNGDKGYGFIKPDNGGQDIFIHISDYPKQGGKPNVGEALSFDVTLNKDGKKKAINVQRPGSSLVSKPKTRVARHQERKSSPFGKVMTALALVAMLGAGYKYFTPKLTTSAPVPVAQAESATSPAPSSNFRCDGRKYCSQMTSCAEAKYFLQNCPNTEMDGDRDGVPCESQWCTSPFAK